MENKKQVIFKSGNRTITAEQVQLLTSVMGMVIDSCEFDEPYITIKKKHKKCDGIAYYCTKLYHTGYELWESKTHPSYSHFMKPKTPKPMELFETTPQIAFNVLEQGNRKIKAEINSETFDVASININNNTCFIRTSKNSGCTKDNEDVKFFICVPSNAKQVY